MTFVNFLLQTLFRSPGTARLSDPDEEDFSGGLVAKMDSNTSAFADRFVERIDHFRVNKILSFLFNVFLFQLSRVSGTNISPSQTALVKMIFLISR